MGTKGWGVLFGAVAMAVAAAVVGAPAQASSPPAPAPAPPPPTVHVVTGVAGAGARLEDDLGRQVLLRGVNVNALGEYHQAAADLATTVPLTMGDFNRMAGLGFDTVRLLVTWSRIEPARDVIDVAYLDRVREAVRMAAQADLRVLVDMHQDAWGPFVDTPAGTGCPPGLAPAIGWDGAPRWATITDGLTTCRFQLRELSPAVGQAWQSFFADRDGIQQELVESWGALAQAVAAEPNVVGWDLLNEPNPGTTVGVSTVLLGRFYDRAIAAIRAGEVAAHAPVRAAFFEPPAYWSAGSVSDVPPPGFTADTQLVFAPHLYAGSITADRAVGTTALSVEQGFTNAATVASAYGTPYFSGEWGWFGDPAVDGASVAEYGRQEDAHLANGTWWDWKQACGDPHNIGVPGGRPGPVSPSLVRFACPSGTELGIPDVIGTVLSRPHPRAVPGVLTSLRSDPTTAELDLTGTTAAAGAADLWVPDRGRGGPVVTGAGVRSASVTRSFGGYRVTVEVDGTYAIAVRYGAPAAATASTTPVSAGQGAATGATSTSGSTGATGSLAATGGLSPVAVVVAAGSIGVVLARRRGRPTLR